MALTQTGNGPAVVTRGLSKRFGDRVAVDQIDLDLPVGVVSGFVGPNGAGKTTTIQMLLGLVRPSEGTAEVLGHSIREPAAYLARVGALVESPAFYPTLSGRRNLAVLARLGRVRPERIDEVLELVGLSDRASDLVRGYSLGMKQRLGVAAALLPDPELVILDEPANGLDPAGIREIRTLLRGLADRGITVFVSSHLLAEIEAICDHLVMINLGKVVFQGAVSELLAAHRSDVIAIPEHAEDLERLRALCEAAGKLARIEAGAVRVQASGDWAAELNRRAMDVGITLRGLETTRASLEEAFFAVTEGGAVLMLGAFASEWVKLRRRGVLLWGVGGGLLFTVLATVFTIERAVKVIAPGFHEHGFRVTVAALSQPDGLVHGVVDVSNLVGVVALCLFAGATASEYSQGTMRNLLVRQPQRAKLLSGKFLALAAFIVLAVLLAILVASGLAFALAPGKGISTSAWTSSTGLSDFGQALLHVELTCLGYGLFGTALAILLRSPGLAIALGVAWVLPIEAIITNAIWSNGDRWLPGQLLSALAHGGNSSSSYDHALLMLAIYAVVAAAGTLFVFARRDA